MAAKIKKILKKKSTQKAVKQYMDFHGKDHAELKEVSIDMPGANDALVHIGSAPEINYLSDKLGRKTTLYKHHVKKFGEIYAYVNPKTGRVSTVIIANLNMRIDKRGLIS